MVGICWRACWLYTTLLFRLTPQFNWFYVWYSCSYWTVSVHIAWQRQAGGFGRNLAMRLALIFVLLVIFIATTVLRAPRVLQCLSGHAHGGCFGSVLPLFNKWNIVIDTSRFGNTRNSTHIIWNARNGTSTRWNSGHGMTRVLNTTDEILKAWNTANDKHKTRNTTDYKHKARNAKYNARDPTDYKFKTWGTVNNIPSSISRMRRNMTHYNLHKGNNKFGRSKLWSITNGPIRTQKARIWSNADVAIMARLIITKWTRTVTDSSNKLNKNDFRRVHTTTRKDHTALSNSVK
jgi:hypothetical protein